MVEDGERGGGVLVGEPGGDPGEWAEDGDGEGLLVIGGYGRGRARGRLGFEGEPQPVHGLVHVRRCPDGRQRQEQVKGLCTHALLVHRGRGLHLQRPGHPGGQLTHRITGHGTGQPRVLHPHRVLPQITTTGQHRLRMRGRETGLDLQPPPRGREPSGDQAPRPRTRRRDHLTGEHRRRGRSAIRHRQQRRRELRSHIRVKPTQIHRPHPTRCFRVSLRTTGDPWTAQQLSDQVGDLVGVGGEHRQGRRGHGRDDRSLPLHLLRDRTHV